MTLTLLKPAMAYFLMVFGAGFMLGPVRTLWLVPRVGTRTVELLELPVMLVAVFLSACWIIRRFDAERTAAPWFLIGLVALARLLAAELILDVALRGVSPTEALISRDPVSGGVYYAALCVFAITPWFLGRSRRRT